jgi:hypothetical protein
VWGGGQQGGYPSHSPLPQVGGMASKIGRSAVSHHVTGLQVTRKGPAETRNGPVRSHVTSVVVGWGRWGRNTISSNTLQLMVISRDLFCKTGVQSLPQPYFNVKVCLPPFHEL